MEVVKGHFRLNHPKFRQVTGRVGVLGAEGGAKGVNLAQGHGAQFTFQLSADGEVGGFSKKVFGEVYLTGVVGGRVLGGEGGDAEQFPGAFGVRRRDDGGIQVEESLFVEEPVHRKGGVVANPHDRAKGVGAHA